jgi:cytochrome c peroxidase
VSVRRAPALAVAAACAALALGCRALSDAPTTDAGTTLGLSADEVAAIVSHGPWPPAFEPDPTNRASGRPAAIELGRRLFDDARASLDGTRRCSTCHDPARGFADGLPRSPGVDGHPLDRNAMGLRDARLVNWFGWDGGADSLWAFVLRPLLDPREIGADDTRLAALFAGDPALACLREAAFGDAPPDAEALRVQVAKAIAAYVETLQSPRTRFDALRDALAAPPGDAAALSAARAYPADALRGLRRFVGDGRCAACHVGPTFTNGEFHDVGRPYMAAPGRPDPGRHGGIRAVLADPYNRLGRWTDATTPEAAVRTRHLAPSHRNFGEFRTPGLRGLSDTAPYGHDGSMTTLDEVVAHYSDLDIERLHADGEALLRPLKLDPAARADLVAFLRTLSEPAGPPAREPAPLRTVAAAPTCGPSRRTQP